MRILIVNDYYEYGGTEVQTKREAKILENYRDEAYILTFDEKFPTREIYEGQKWFNLNVNKSIFFKSLNKFCFNLKLYKYMQQVIYICKPDIIHFNNINYSPFTELLAVKNIPIVQTIRDYASICPKVTCIKPDKKGCRGYITKKCRNCILKKPTLIIRYLHLIFFNNYRRKKINHFLCPSERLTILANENGLKTSCVHNPFDFNLLKGIEDKKPSSNIVKYIFYGLIRKDKGIIELIDAFQEFSLNKENVELIIAGKLEKDCVNEINEKVRVDKKIKYIGRMEYKEMIQIVNDCHYIVVPSLWMENYPNTVLESMALGKVVLASNRGGMPLMIENNDLLFDILKKEDIVDKLNFSYDLKIQEYAKIAIRNKNYVNNNNTETQFYEKLIDVFEELKKGRNK